MMDQLIRCIGMALCLAVMVGCVCRADKMTASAHRLGWYLMYVLMAVYAFGVLLDLAHERWVDWYEAAGVAGMLLHILNTRRMWAHGAPAEARKACQ